MRCNCDRDLLLSVLPVISTQEVVPVIIKIVKEKHRDLGFRTTIMLNTMVLTIDPTPAVVMNLLVSAF